MLDLLNFEVIIIVVDMTFSFYLNIDLSSPCNLYFCVTHVK